MKTIEQCKQEIAENHQQTSWKNFIWNHFSGDLTPRAINLLWEEVCELYASQFLQPDVKFQLPSDKEIEDNVSLYNLDRQTLAEKFVGESGFRRGAQWMRMQIERQIKRGN